MIRYQSAKAETVPQMLCPEIFRPIESLRSGPEVFWLPTKMTRLPFLLWRAAVLSLRCVAPEEYQTPPKVEAF